MAAATLTHIREVAPNTGVKRIKLELDTATTNGMTYALTLASYGIKTFEAFKGYEHSTEDSIVIAENPASTTAVSSGVLTITIGGSTATTKRTFIIVGDSY